VAKGAQIVRRKPLCAAQGVGRFSRMRHKDSRAFVVVVQMLKQYAIVEGITPSAAAGARQTRAYR
jgi:hypothetical protein